MSQLRQLIYNLNVIFKAASSDDFPSFSIPLGLGHLIVLLSHVHVPRCISCVLLAAVIQARELLCELFGASSDVFFPLIFSLN